MFIWLTNPITGEKKVDDLANVLHMVILDNPAVFTPVKEGQYENVCNSESEDR